MQASKYKLGLQRLLEAARAGRAATPERSLDTRGATFLARMLSEPS